MDMKDTLELGDPDDVGGSVECSLMPSSSSSHMDMRMSRGVSCEADGQDMQQVSIVVMPVAHMEEEQDVMGKTLQLVDPSDGPSADGSDLMRMAHVDVDQIKDPNAPYDPVTQSWFTTKYSKDSLSEQGHKWKQGMWSQDEIALLQNNIEEYVTEHKMADASEVIFNSSKDNRKNFYRSIARGLQRPLFAVYRRVIRMYDHKNHLGRYTAEDIKKLKMLRARHGNDWAYIGSEMGRSASSVKDKFRLLKDSCNRGKWSVDEETLLTDAVFSLSGVQPGESVTTGISWSQVADKVGTRTEKQCRAKWLNYLNWKQTGGAEWSRNDDLTLIHRIHESGIEVESDIDWEGLARDWKSVRSPQWLRSKWWSLKRQVPFNSQVNMKTLLENLKTMQVRRRVREERSFVSGVSLEPLPTQVKNGTVTVQVPIQLGSSSVGAGGIESAETTGLTPLAISQSALSNLPATSALFMGSNLTCTTVHADNHIIIQVTNLPGNEGHNIGTEGNTRQIIITPRQPRQTLPSLDQDETDMCGHIHPSDPELSGDASAIGHSGDDLQTSSDHMTSGMGQSQVSVGEEQPISRDAQLIGTDAVLPQQGVSNADLVGGGETEATLVVVNTAPSTDELSQPTSGTVEDAQLGGGVFTLAGSLPVLQTQGDEHNLMGSPGHLDALHHHDDVEEEEEVVRSHPGINEMEVEEETVEEEGVGNHHAQGVDEAGVDGRLDCMEVEEEEEEEVDVLTHAEAQELVVVGIEEVEGEEKELEQAVMVKNQRVVEGQKSPRAKARKRRRSRYR